MWSGISFGCKRIKEDIHGKLLIYNPAFGLISRDIFLSSLLGKKGSGKYPAQHPNPFNLCDVTHFLNTTNNKQ